MSESLRRSWPYLLILIAVLAAYGGVTGFDFVRWDDVQLITENSLVRTHSPAIFWTYDPELFVPLTLLTYQVEHALVGFVPEFFHGTNLLLHTGTALLAFALLSHILKDQWLALLGALVFAVHPLQAEAVSWVSARKELLMTMFSLGSILVYTAGRRPAPMWGILLFLLALLSKATAIILPLLLIAIDLWKRERLRSSIVGKWPFWLLSIVFGIIAFFGRGDAAKLLSMEETTLLAFRSTAFYVEKFLVPVGLSAIHPATLPISMSDPAIILSIIIVGLLVTLAWFLQKRIPAFTLGVAWFLIALLPSFLAYQKTNDVTLAAERYAYLPNVGLVIALCALVRWISDKHRAWTVLCLSLCLVLIPLARLQSRTWESSESVFQNVLKIYPDSHVAKNNIAFLRLNEGKLEEALALATEAVSHKPTYADAWVNIGAALGRLNRIDEAEKALQQALDIDPGHPQAHFNLGGVYGVRERWSDAEQQYRETIHSKPRHAAAHFRLALALVQLNRMEEARAAYATAIALDPGYERKIMELE